MDYENGDITVMEMLRHLLTQYEALDTQLQALEVRKASMREQIKALVVRQGEKPTRVDGWELVVTNGYERRYTDPKALAALAVDLQATYPDIADRMLATVKTSTVPEQLRMTKERKHGNDIPF